MYGALRNVSFLFVIAIVFTVPLPARAETVPLPRARRDFMPADRPEKTGEEAKPSPCQLQLSELGEFKPAPSITGPGECTAADVVTFEAVLLTERHRVVFSPAVTLRCPMAEAVAHWIRDDVAPTVSSIGKSLRSVKTLDSFSCRNFNGISGARISEHGRANALDVGAFELSDGTTIELTDASVSKSLREKLRESACVRFSTVLGNGADAYHETHVHIDLMERTNHYKICQWDVLDAPDTAALEASKSAAGAAQIPAVANAPNGIPLPRPRPVVHTDVSKLPRHGIL
jgi:hypothetical protein